MSHGLGFLPGCENPNGCRKMAVYRVEARRRSTGEVVDEANLCAYCAPTVDVPAGYECRRTDLTAETRGGDR